MTTTIIQAGVNQKDFIGNLNLRDKLFKVTGTVYSLGQIPVETHFKLIPEDGSDPLDFEYKLETKENGYIVIGNIQHSQKFAKFEFNMTAIQKFDWQFDLQVRIIFFIKQILNMLLLLDCVSYITSILYLHIRFYVSFYVFVFIFSR